MRPAKLNDVRVQYGDSVEVMPIEDIATGDYTEALKGSLSFSLPYVALDVVDITLVSSSRCCCYRPCRGSTAHQSGS